MKIEIRNKKLNDIKTDLEIILVPAGKLKHKWVVDEKEIKKNNYKAEADEVLHLSGVGRVYAGISSLEAEDIKIGVALAYKKIRKIKYRTAKIGLYFKDDDLSGVKAITEGVLLASYRFERYKSKSEKEDLAKIIVSTEVYEGVSGSSLKELKNAVLESSVGAEAVNFTRDIVNMPPFELTPPEFANIARQAGRESNLKVKVHGEKYLSKEGMGAFLAVSRASKYQPQLIHLSYKPRSPKKKIVLVGKGLTYDTGGLSLKPGDAMVSMKIDMGGAGAILGAIKAVSKLGLDIEVHAVIGATENAIGKDAYKPDDILTAKNGKTIEVKNTDAEGRLVLADCLVYAQELDPDHIIDMATLTGACVVGLGEYTSGVMGYDQDLKRSMISAASRSGEFAADLPFNRYLPKLLKSEIADISNLSSSKYGGAITAALFLGDFIEKRFKNKWLHIDIAGPAFVKNEWGYNGYGASGAGVRMLLEWLKSLR